MNNYNDLPWDLKHVTDSFILHWSSMRLWVNTQNTTDKVTSFYLFDQWCWFDVRGALCINSEPQGWSVQNKKICYKFQTLEKVIIIFKISGVLCVLTWNLRRGQYNSSNQHHLSKRSNFVGGALCINSELQGWSVQNKKICYKFQTLGKVIIISKIPGVLCVLTWNLRRGQCNLPKL